MEQNVIVNTTLNVSFYFHFLLYLPLLCPLLCLSPFFSFIVSSVLSASDNSTREYWKQNFVWHHYTCHISLGLKRISATSKSSWVFWSAWCFDGVALHWNHPPPPILRDGECPRPQHSTQLLLYGLFFSNLFCHPLPKV